MEDKIKKAIEEIEKEMNEGENVSVGIRVTASFFTSLKDLAQRKNKDISLYSPGVSKYILITKEGRFFFRDIIFKDAEGEEEFEVFASAINDKGNNEILCSLLTIAERVIRERAMECSGVDRFAWQT